MHTKEAEHSKLWLSHDDLYFGDSKSSIGIQIADLCCHVLLRYFRDGIQDEFLNLIAPNLRCAKPEPYWSQCNHVLRSHEPLLPLFATVAEALALKPADEVSTSEPTTPDVIQS